MTEEEWKAGPYPLMLLNHIRLKRRIPPTQRKFRLLACSLLWRIQHLLPDERSIQAVRTAESFADGQATVKDMTKASRDANSSLSTIRMEPGRAGLIPAAMAAHELTYVPKPSSHSSRLLFGNRIPNDLRRCGKMASTILHYARMAEMLVSMNNGGKSREDPGPYQCELIRDIFGNPFRPVTLDPSWLTSTVLALANGIYAERAFDRMPILADALQDAGCGNEDILNHCRQPGEHVRGCWVVDLLTGRS
jgi:hypothetical protein